VCQRRTGSCRSDRVSVDIPDWSLLGIDGGRLLLLRRRRGHVLLRRCELRSGGLCQAHARGVRPSLAEQRRQPPVRLLRGQQLREGAHERQAPVSHLQAERDDRAVVFYRWFSSFQDVLAMAALEPSQDALTQQKLRHDS